MNESWRFQARTSVALAALFALAGGALGYAGLTRASAPPAVLTVLVDRTGEIARAAFVDEDPEARELTVRGMLATYIIRDAREMEPDEPRMKAQFERLSPFFRNQGALRMRAHLARAQFYKQAIRDGMRRVIDGRINARCLTPCEDNRYRVDWTEETFTRTNQSVPGSRREQSMEVVIGFDEALDPGVRLMNPAGMFIDDFQWSVTD